MFRPGVTFSCADGSKRISVEPRIDGNTTRYGSRDRSSFPSKWAAITRYVSSMLAYAVALAQPSLEFQLQIYYMFCKLESRLPYCDHLGFADSKVARSLSLRAYTSDRTSAITLGKRSRNCSINFLPPTQTYRNIRVSSLYTKSSKFRTRNNLFVIMANLSSRKEWIKSCKGPISFRREEFLLLFPLLSDTYFHKNY